MHGHEVVPVHHKSDYLEYFEQVDVVSGRKQVVHGAPIVWSSMRDVGSVVVSVQFCQDCHTGLLQVCVSVYLEARRL